MATRSLNADALPALERLELERSERLGLRRLHGFGSWTLGALVLDAAMLAAGAAAAQLGAGDAGILRVSPVWLVVYGGLVLLFMRFRGMYSWRLRVSALDDVRAVVAATALASVSVLTLRILFPGEVDDLASQSLRLLAFSAVYVAAGRVALDWALLRGRRDGDLAKPTLIVGAGRIGRLTATRLLDHPELGLKPVGFIDKEPLDEPGLPAPVLGASWDLERLIEQHGVEHVVITFSTAPSEVLLRELQRCEELGVSVSLVPRLFERVTERLTVDHIGGLPLLSTRRADPKGWQFAVKYLVDRAVAAVLLLLTLPVLAVAALAVRLSVGSPVLFRQRRVGLDGREFDMLKLRTMSGTPTDGEADSDWAREQLGEQDGPRARGLDRATRVGRFLRATLDRRAPAALQRAGRRDVAGGAAAGAQPLRPPVRGEGVPLRRPPPRQVRDHRLVAGERAPRQDLAERPGRVGQLLHRELVALARRQDPADDGLGRAPLLRAGRVALEPA